VGKTIFMIHGMWGSAWCWENYRQALEAEGYRCIATTLPYHNMDPSDKPDPRLGTASLLDYADALEHEIRLLDEKPIIIGHSMGGLLAQMLAERDLAQAIVLLSPAAPSGIMGLSPTLLRSSWSIQSKWGFWRNPMRLTFSEAAYSVLHRLPKNEQQEIYGKFVYESGRAGCEIFYWFFDPHRASRVDATKVTCPLLIATGALDRGTPARVVRRIAKKYKHVSSYKEFKSMGHWILGEPGWEEVTEYIAAWLESLKTEQYTARIK
jgi:pimeloyl-ACP methyl ester carboxylesterase